MNTDLLYYYKFRLKVSKFFWTFLWWGDSERLFFVIIKVTCVSGSFAFGDEWGLNLKYKHKYYRTIHCVTDTLLTDRKLKDLLWNRYYREFKDSIHSSISIYSLFHKSLQTSVHNKNTTSRTNAHLSGAIVLLKIFS